jgi:hypothetical protein
MDGLLLVLAARAATATVIRPVYFRVSTILAVLAGRLDRLTGQILAGAM